MLRGGRPKDPIWEHFYLLEDGNKKSAQCKKCLRLQSIKACRMKTHYEKCPAISRQLDSNASEKPATFQDPTPMKPDPMLTFTAAVSRQPLKTPGKRPATDSIHDECPRPAKRLQLDLNSHFVRTTAGQKEQLDEKVAEFIYACNLAFNVAEHPMFLAMLDALRPGYKPPNRKALSTKHLDKTHERLQTNMKANLEGKVVTIQQDGWSNIHNDPVIATSVTCDGKGYFLDAVETGTTSKTGENCKEMLMKSVTLAREKYGCQVKSVVTDNAKNMEKMRRALKEEPDIIGYGCLAHWLNLLGKDLTLDQVMKHVVAVNKYFRNHHIPGALLKNCEGSVKPQLPGDTRWKSQEIALVTYLTNRRFFIQLIQDHGEDIDQSIAKKIMDNDLYRKIKDLAEVLRPVTVAIDKAQRDTTCLADATEIFLGLLNNPVLTPYKAKVQKRFDDAILPCHLAAYMLHPKYAGENLSTAQIEVAKGWLIERNESFLVPAISFQAQAEPFPASFFRAEARGLKPTTWWKGVAACTDLPQGFLALMNDLHTACASSASLERIFSSFGLVHTKLRNKLGIAKAQKLVYCYRMLRGPAELEY